MKEFLTKDIEHIGDIMVTNYPAFIKDVGKAQENPVTYQTFVQHAVAICAGGSVRSLLLSQLLADGQTYTLARPLIGGMQVYELCTKIRTAPIQDGVVHIPRYKPLHTIVVGIEHPSEADLLEDIQSTLNHAGAQATIVVVNGSERDARMNIVTY